MKTKIFFLSIFSLFLLVSFVAAAPCTVTGYQSCSQQTNNFHDTNSFAKVWYNLKDLSSDGYPANGYAVKKLFFDYGSEGDDLHIVEDVNSWDDVDCDEYGITLNSGQDFLIASDNGQYPIASSGEYNKRIALVSYDYDESSGWWSCVYTGYGWVGTSYLNYKIVQCEANSDCSGGQICNKAGDWKSWSCVTPECNVGQTKCEGTNSFSCSNDKWVNNGATVGQCTVQCTDSTQCGAPDESEPFCSTSGNVVKTVTTKVCSSYACSGTPQETAVETCQYGCDSGICKGKPAFNYWWIILGSLAVVVIIGIIYFVKRKK